MVGQSVAQKRAAHYYSIEALLPTADEAGATYPNSTPATVPADGLSQQGSLF